MVPSRSMIAALMLENIVFLAGSRLAGQPGQLGAAGIDDCLVIRLAENGGTSYEGVGARFGCLRDIVDFDAAIDFQMNIAAAGIDALTYRGDFLQGFGNERLAAETGIDRHDQD